MKLRYVAVVSVSVLVQVITMSCTKNVFGPEPNLDWTIYTTADGLSSRIVYDLAIDSLDRVWVGTLKGINVFDGMKWDTIDAADGLPFEDVSVLHFDNQGNLWIAYSGGPGRGVVKYDGNTFTYYDQSDGLSVDHIEAIASESDGTVWVGTIGGGACKFDGSVWTCYDTMYVNHRHLYYIYVQNDTSIWFGTHDGVTHYNGQTWTKYLRWFETEPLPRMSPQTQNRLPYFKVIEAIGFTPDSIGWFGFEFGVYEYKHGQFTIHYLRGIDLVGLSDAALDQKGHIWLSSYSYGIYTLWDGRWLNYSVGDGLPDYYVTSVEVDSKGNLWFGTGKGLAKLTIK